MKKNNHDLRIGLMVCMMAFMVVFVAACGGSSGITIAQKGHSPYAIVLSDAASSSEKYAADELKYFIELATDADVRIVGEDDKRAQEAPRIFIGAGNAASAVAGDRAVDPGAFGDEEYVLRTIGEGSKPDFLIAGGRTRGTMYGVYALLDTLGFRWYTNTLTRFPKGKKLTIQALDIRTKPAFMSRDTSIKEARDADWAARNRMNSGHSQLDAARGGKVLVNGVHTLDRLVPPELFEKHPEYFPLIGGKRVTGLVQRCMSNPEIVDIAVENLRKWMDEEPDQHIFSVSANDVGMLCQCDECRRITEEEGATAGLFLHFVNKVAEKIEESHPDNYISTLAYAITETAPKNIKPRKNVIIRLCPFYICCGHSFTTCNKPASVNFYKTLKNWGAISDNIFIWHYATNFDAYLLPFPNFNEFAYDIGVYDEHGVNGLFLQGAGKAGSSDGDMRAWVASRMMWNPKQDPNTLVNEWMHAVYGAAYTPMRAVYDHMHERVADPENHLGIHDRILKDYWPDEEIALLDSLYDEAENLAAGDDDALFYIGKNRMSIRYLKLLFGSGHLVLKGDSYQTADNTVTREEYEQYRADMEKYGVEGLREEPFDCLYEDLLGEKLVSHETVSIENDDIRVVVAPDLGGRIIGLFLKETGGNILERTDPENYFYPCYGGYEESTTMTWGRTGFSNDYSVEIDGRTMILIADEGISGRAKGLIFKRTMTLPAKGKRIDFTSTITNITNGTKYARHVSHMEVSADPMASKTGWKNAAGKMVEEDAKNFYKNGKNKPAGTWYVKSPAGWTMESHFNPRDVEACRLMCYQKSASMEMEVLGFEKNLAPGETLTRKHSWIIR